ncbi:MAG TPA: WG repeat-containing protein [Candidatus Galloscillospira excrementavium]|nr:WG repeat-containing protein [Candidatus Galloscillospira excrementavium]
MKKIGSLCLALCLCLGLLPTAALAADDPPAAYTTSTGLTLQGEKLYQNVSGLYRGDGVYTREEEGDLVLYDENGGVTGRVDAETVGIRGEFHCGLAPVEAFDPYTAEEGYGYIDATGTLVVPAQYEYASAFTLDEMARVQNKNYKYGYVNASGQEVIPCQYDVATPFNDGYAAVRISSGNTTEMMIIDTAGNTVWKSPGETFSDMGGTYTYPIYDCDWLSPQLVADGSFMLEKQVDGGGYMAVLLDIETGETRELSNIVSPQYDRHTRYLGQDRVYYYKNGYRAVLNLEGNVIIPYGEVQATSYMGLLRTEEGLVDLNGNVVLSAADGWSNISLNDDLKIVNATYNPTYTVYRFMVGGGSAPTEPEEPAEPETPLFTDVPDWCASEVAWAVERGITNGTTPTTFSPDNTCNTAQILTFLWRAAGEPAPAGGADGCLPQGAYYAEAVTWADQEGLLSLSDFAEGAPCTRAMVAEYLWKLEGSPAVSGENPFTDVAAGAGYAQAVLWAAQQGITEGTTPTTFTPDRECTRAQIVTFLYRAFAA